MFFKDCVWQIETNQDYRFELNNFNIDLEYVPDYASCYGRDFLEIHDYKSSKQDYLVSLCRNDGYKQILSSDNKMRIRFVSNELNISQKKGIEFTIKIWSKCSFFKVNYHLETS